MGSFGMSWNEGTDAVRNRVCSISGMKRKLAGVGGVGSVRGVKVAGKSAA
jgi:hypothetical protein